jgi:hypothetical protein
MVFSENRASARSLNSLLLAGYDFVPLVNDDDIIPENFPRSMADLNSLNGEFDVHAI